MSTEPYVPTLEEMRTDYIMAYDERGGSQLLAGAAFDRGIAGVKADALREAVEEFEGNIGPGEFVEQTSRDGRHWTYIAEAWDNQGPFMDWLRNRADRIEEEA